MNLYFVLSKNIHEYGGQEDAYGYDPPEDYCIVELVIAKSAAQAKYIAWKKDDPFAQNIEDMPKFQVRLRQKDVGGEPRIVTDEEEFASVESNWDI